MSGNVRCPSCQRVLRPPGTAARFRCPCGQILARPAAATARAPVTTAPARNTSTTTSTTRQPAQSFQVDRSQPTQTRVRCPSCRTVLLPPAGARQFKCSNCNIILKAPSSNNASNTSSSLPPRNTNHRATMARPTAAATPVIPRGSSFRGLFRRPQQADTSEEGTLPSTGKKINENLSPDQIVSLVAGNTKEHWLRNLGENETICWVRLLSADQEKKIAKLLGTWEEDMREKIDELEEYDLKSRIEMLECFRSVDLSNEAAMKTVLLSAKSTLLRTQKMPKIIDILNNLHVDHTTCRNFESCVERLMAAVWYGPTRLCDGFVREFKENPKLGLDMIPAQQYGLPLDYKSYGITYGTLERLTNGSFQNKVKWFKEQCDKARVPWEQGRVELKINRKDILQDSFYKFQSIKPEDFKKQFKFEFENEIGIDAGGLSREWFEQVTDACFNVDCGLFEYSGVDNICYQFNPNSGIANDLHLDYFRFIGNIVGKALFDQKYIKAHLTLPLFKHILGYPITVDDIEFCDQKIHEHLKEMEDMEDVSMLLLTFCCTISIFGEISEIELKPGGGEIDVTNANVQEYILLMTKHYMFERTKHQLAHFLQGIYDVVPELWLSIFDYRELELLLCGLPVINVRDWKQHTRYNGEFSYKKEKHKVVRWFWEYVESRNQEQKAKLLQFCTGTSRVPVAGFGSLQGKSGKLTPFTLVPVSTSKLLYPRAHTCFNRLDLPLYRNRKDLFKYLSEACDYSNGFDDE